MIQSLNFFIISTRTFRYRQGDVALENLAETFNFRGKLAYFVEDDSYIWDQGKVRAEPIEVADALFEFITELAMSQDPLLDSLLDVFRDYVWVAFFGSVF